MRQAVAIVLGCLVAGALSGSAHACSCARSPTAEGILASAAAVFTGTVRAVGTTAPHQSVTTFVVTEAFKGVRPGEIVDVHHHSGSPAACGVTFEYGRSYTLSAAMDRGALHASQCSTWMFLPHVGLSRDLIATMRSLRRRQ